MASLEPEVEILSFTLAFCTVGNKPSAGRSPEHQMCAEPWFQSALTGVQVLGTLQQNTG
jgi:hypothetical protein